MDLTELSSITGGGGAWMICREKGGGMVGGASGSRVTVVQWCLSGLCAGKTSLGLGLELRQSLTPSAGKSRGLTATRAHTSLSPSSPRSPSKPLQFYSSNCLTLILKNTI